MLLDEVTVTPYFTLKMLAVTLYVVVFVTEQWLRRRRNCSRSSCAFNGHNFLPQQMQPPNKLKALRMHLRFQYCRFPAFLLFCYPLLACPGYIWMFEPFLSSSHGYRNNPLHSSQSRRQQQQTSLALPGLMFVPLVHRRTMLHDQASTGNKSEGKYATRTIHTNSRRSRTHRRKVVPHCAGLSKLQLSDICCTYWPFSVVVVRNSKLMVKQKARNYRYEMRSILLKLAFFR